MRGLTATDFTVLEGGKPQTIATFSAVDLPDIVTTTEQPASWVREVAPDVQRNTDVRDRRLLVLVLDDATPMPAADTIRAKTYARRIIERLTPGDLAAVVFPLNKGAGHSPAIARGCSRR